MNEIFPINEYPQKRYDETRAAFGRLIARFWGADAGEQRLTLPALVIETFAGLGGQTRILAEAFGGWGVIHRGWEKDPACYAELAKVHASCGDGFAASEVDLGEFPVHYFEALEQEHLHPTLLVVDGAYSLAQHADYEKYHDPRAEYLIICEQARTRLHLHRRTYGLSEDKKGLELYEEYLEKVAERHGRPLLGYEPTPYSPCYVLLGPVQS